MEELIGGGAPAGGSQQAAKDIGEAEFQAEVLEASMQAPVIVDFWAPWCEPCKQLTPALEKIVGEQAGKVRLVKVNVDENQAIAQQLRIQSLPTVYAFHQGRPVDGFQGALQESQLREFVSKLVEAAGGEAQNPVEEALAKANELAEAGDHQAAAQLYGQILQHEPENTKAISGAIRALAAAGDVAGARQIYDGLSEALKVHGEVEGAMSAVELAEQSQSAAGDVAELMEKVAHDPNDHQARFDLAMALNAAGKREAAVEELLEIITRERSWNDEAARKQLVTFFEAWGPTDPLTLEARRRLSSLLFA